MRQESGRQPRPKKRLKPSWLKTDIPKPVRIVLYRIMKDYPTQVAREQAVAGSEELEKLEADFGETPTSRDTFERLTDEIEGMPASEVSTLPQDLRDWILELRPELKGELEKREQERAGGGSNWIEAYEAMHGVPPALPEGLCSLFFGYRSGEPISKEMKPGIPSMQHWGRLLPSEKDQFHDVLRWLGIDPRDHEARMRSLGAPKGNGQPFRLTYGPPRPRQPRS